MNKLLSASDAPVGAAAAAVVLGAVAALLFFLPILSIPLGCCGVLFGVAGIVWALGRDAQPALVDRRTGRLDRGVVRRRCHRHGSGRPAANSEHPAAPATHARAALRCAARAAWPVAQPSLRSRDVFVVGSAGNRPTSGVANPQLVAMLTSAAGRTVLALSCR